MNPPMRGICAPQAALTRLPNGNSLPIAATGANIRTRSAVRSRTGRDSAPPDKSKVFSGPGRRVASPLCDAVPRELTHIAASILNILPVPRLFLIDTFGFIFRAYHARARSGAPPMRTSTGLSTEAVFIFHNMLRKLLTSYKPDYIAAIFESSEAHIPLASRFAEYKANRTEMPPDLVEQIPYIRRLLEAMRIPILRIPGFEADDVIGTIAWRAAPKPLDVVIVSSDKDMLQLVNDHVFMLNPMKDDEWYDAAKVEEFMGVKPVAGGRSAGAQRRRHRQHSRRARHRR